MATLADSIVSSSSRPLSLRMRPDLSARQHRYRGRSYWVVKEPIGLNYFRFHEEEYAILNMLDGHSSLEAIKERFEREFTPQKITYQDLQQFIGMLHRSGLVVSQAAGQGRQLKKRRDDKKKKELIGKFSNVFAVRFRGFDPERLLNWLIPYTGWLFSPAAIIFVLMLGLSALSLVMVQFDEFSSRLPTFHQFFGPSNWLWLAITMGTVKVLHEFGHGLSCKKFGGECHELGAMLLVFTPCLYCNVSDSWMLPNKWQRVFIGAAGMYVEVFLASIATFLWWFSEPGLLNHLCLSMMFICSVSTLIFNGNPLLRFDGYYILMDILEIPNLRQKSTEVLKRWLVQTCLGIEQPENPFLPQGRQWLFALYTIAAVIYRWVVVISIVLFLNQVLEPYGLKIIGRLVAITGLFGLVVQPLWQLWKFFTTPGRIHKVKYKRVAATAAVLAAVLAFVMWVPLPFHVECPVEIQPRDAEMVFAGVPGRIVDVHVSAGQKVEAGQVLARLDSIDLYLEIARLEGNHRELQTQLTSLLRQRHDDSRAIAQIGQTQELLTSVKEQLDEKQDELSRLEIKAPVAGTVLTPPGRPKQPSGDGRLPSWTGEPFDAANRGAFLEDSDLVCQIGDPLAMEAVLIVNQADVELIQIGNEVEVKIDAIPNLTYTTSIEEIAKNDLKQTSAALSSQMGGQLETKMDKTGASRPIDTSFQARAPMNASGEVMRTGLRGRAKVYPGWQPLSTRFFRFMAKTFHFEL